MKEGIIDWNDPSILEKRPTKIVSLEEELLAYPSISSRALSTYENAVFHVDKDGAGAGPAAADGVVNTIIGENKKDKVFEVKSYFPFNMLPLVVATYSLWTIFYFIYRAGWTLNTQNPGTYVWSASFLFVEFVSFFATVIHYNNFLNITTNVLQMTLPQILHKRKLDYAKVNVFICCYKEPAKIVNKTLQKAMAMNYPPDRLNVTICDDSSNFKEERGREHLKGMERVFLNNLLRRAVVKVFSKKYHAISEETEDRMNLMSEVNEKITKSTKNAIECEVKWFIAKFLCNPWPVESEIIDDRSVSDEEVHFLDELISSNYSPYRTLTETDLEIIDRISIQGLRTIHAAEPYFQPLVHAALFKKNHIKNRVEKYNLGGKLKYLTPQAIELSGYQALFLGRIAKDDQTQGLDTVVSIGNVRIDFVATDEIQCPSGTYIRRLKPRVPHNKAGNINNALFNESTEADFEYLLLLDADQKPHANLLQRVLPYFYSENGKMIAWIQTPQFFSNIFPIDDPLGHRNMEFYGPVMEGRGSEGCCPFVGTNAVFRRSALCEIGGIMYNSVTEDMYTGMKLHVAGYKSLYHNEVLCIGTAPVDLKETLEQRKRWAQGAVEIFSLTPWRFLFKKLGFRKALYSLDSCIYPFLAPTAFYYALAPVIITLWAVPIVVQNPLLFVFIGVIPTLVLPRVVQYIILRAERPHEEGRSGPPLWVTANDLWRAEQTFFGFSATNISAWHHGRKSIQRLILKYNVRGNLGMWNWNRDFLKEKQASKVGGQANGAKKAPSKKLNTEQTFRTSNKDVATLKNTRLFLPNLFMFSACVLAIVHSLLGFNCENNSMWLLIVVAGFAFSTCWHLWSFIPMALRTREDEWPYHSSYHAHNLLLAAVISSLVFLYSEVRWCI